MLSLRHLSITIAKRTIISNLDLTIRPSTVHAILGPNGSGKSSLLLAIMGHPRYHVTSGSIMLRDTDITVTPPETRSRMGLFLALQHVPEIP